MASSAAARRPRPARHRPAGGSIAYEETPGCASAPLAAWRRRRPEQTALWTLVAGALPAFRAHIEDATGRGLPPYVDRELTRYIDCGLLERGFARVRCRSCKGEILVAYSCKGRGLCPSCTSRRMADTAAHLVIA